MKNSRTMYETAKAVALEKGPRKIGRLIGFYLTSEELKHIYLIDGFNPNRKTMATHIETWKAIGTVKAFTIGSTNVVFFLMPDSTAGRTEINRIKAAYPDAEDTSDPGVLCA